MGNYEKEIYDATLKQQRKHLGRSFFKKLTQKQSTEANDCKDKIVNSTNL